MPTPRATSQTESVRAEELAWFHERQRLLEQLSSDFTGKSWLQLSLATTGLIQTPPNIHLAVEQLEPLEKAQSASDKRLTSLPADCADLVLCDQLTQTHSNLEQLLNEIDHLLRPGGLVVLSGAGSLRGRLAAGVNNQAPGLSDITEKLDAYNWQIKRCHSHGSQRKIQAWRRQLNHWKNRLAAQSARYFPSSLNTQLHWAATRPGWVILLSDSRYNFVGRTQSAPTNKTLQLKPTGGAALVRKKHSQTSQARSNLS